MEKAKLGKLKLEKLDHVSIAVKDAHKLINTWYQLFGIDGWTELDLGGVDAKGRKWNGKEYRVEIGNVAIELIEPGEGRIFQSRFLDTFGPGLHHVAFDVDDIDKRLAELTAKGAKILLQDPGEWAYLQSGCDDGMIIEIHRPTEPKRKKVIIKK